VTQFTPANSSLASDMDLTALQQHLFSGIRLYVKDVLNVEFIYKFHACWNMSLFAEFYKRTIVDITVFLSFLYSYYFGKVSGMLRCLNRMNPQEQINLTGCLLKLCLLCQKRAVS
jgi:hypothetical protein